MEDFVHDFFERFFGGQQPQEYRQNKQEIWIALNSFLLLKKPFDPYPFILLKYFFWMGVVFVTFGNV